MNLRLWLFLVAMPCLTWYPISTKAATTCTASAPNIVISGYNGSTQVSASTTVMINCDSSPTFFPGTVRVRLCLYIDGTPRRLTSSAQSLNYDLYTAGSTVWQAPSPSPPAQQSFDLTYNTGFLSGGSGSTTVPVTARIPAQPVVLSGTYSQMLGGNSTSGEFRASEPGLFGAPTTVPTSCKTGGTESGVTSAFPFTTTAQVTSTCKINAASDLNFGSVDGFITAPVNQTSQISLECVGGTAWQLGLNNGINASGAQRRMKDGFGNFVNYEFYREASRSNRLGNALNVDTVTGTGSGSSQAVTVYGQVPVQTATPGDYSDTITVTVTY